MVAVHKDRAAPWVTNPKRFPLFSFLFAPQGRAEQEGKKRLCMWGGLPRAAASAALPWAIIRPPLRGSMKAKQQFFQIRPCPSIRRSLTANTIASCAFSRLFVATIRIPVFRSSRMQQAIILLLTNN